MVITIILKKLTLIIKYAIIVALSLAFALSFAELFIRYAVFDPGAYYVYQPGWEIYFKTASEKESDPPKRSHVVINRLGLRGDLPERGAFPKILTVGGSTTDSLYLDMEDTWSGQLQSFLRNHGWPAWVGNMGKAGTNARHHALQLEKTLDRLPHPDLVVVLCGLNDMLFDFGIHHPPGLGNDWDRRQAFMYAPPEDGGWLGHLALYRFAAAVVRRLPYLKDNPLIRVREVAWRDRLDGYQERRRAVAESDFIRDVPDLTQALAAYRANLTRIADLVAAHQEKVIFLTQPYVWNENMGAEELTLLYAGGVGSPDAWFANPHNKWYHQDVMSRMLGAYNDVMKKFCKDKNVECIDVEGELRKVAANFVDDFHFSKIGSSEVARIVGERIQAELQKMESRAAKGTRQE